MTDEYVKHGFNVTKGRIDDQCGKQALYHLSFLAYRLCSYGILIRLLKTASALSKIHRMQGGIADLS